MAVPQTSLRYAMGINMIKRILFAVFALVLVIFAGACAENEASPSKGGSDTLNSQTDDKTELIKVRLAIDTAAGGSFQIRVAKAQGFFEKYGIDAEISNFAYGIDTVNALLVQQSDTALAADYALVNSLGKGDLVVVSSLTRTNDKSAERTLLFVRDDINSPEDLKGRKLGVQKGTVYEYVWAKYLEKNNIDEGEIEYVLFSTPDEAMVSLQNGDMDAIWMGGAMSSKFTEIKGVKTLGNVFDSDVNISSFLLLERSFAEQNPDAAASILKAVNDGINYIPGHEKETAELAFKELKLPVESVLDDLKYTNFSLGFSQEDFEHLEDIKKWSEDHGILTDKYDLKEKINTEPLKKSFPELLTYTP